LIKGGSNTLNRPFRAATFILVIAVFAMPSCCLTFTYLQEIAGLRILALHPSSLTSRVHLDGPFIF
jgi:hypothetical protein